MSLPFASSSAFSNALEAKSHPLFSNWSSSSSVTSDDTPSFRSSPITFDYMTDTNSTSPSTPSEGSSYQSYELSMSQTLSAFSEPSLGFTSSSPHIPSSTLYKTYPPSLSDSQNFSSYSQFALSHGPSDDQFAFDGIPPVMGVNWESPGSKVGNGAYKLPPANDFSVRIFDRHQL